MPKMLSLGEPVRIMSLIGEGKMSKSNPNGAILLDDPVDVSLNKVKRAQSAFAGEMSESLDSLIKIGKFVSDKSGQKEIDELVSKHMNGESVMKDLKDVIIESLRKYLTDFQEKKSQMSDSEVLEIAKKGGIIAKKNAQETIQEARNAVGLKYI
jgi:tryptophanyl-tRNA synthetase